MIGAFLNISQYSLLCPKTQKKTQVKFEDGETQLWYVAEVNGTVYALSMALYVTFSEFNNGSETQRFPCSISIKE